MEYLVVLFLGNGNGSSGMNEYVINMRVFRNCPHCSVSRVISPNGNNLLRVTSFTKLHEFQYKILNNCLTTNVFLHKIGIYPSSARFSFVEMWTRPLSTLLYSVTIMRVSGQE